MQICFDGIQIEIAEEVLRQFHKCEQHFGEDEAGGILLGKKRRDNTYLITEITLPNSRDLAGPCFFVRNKDSAQKVIDLKWNESKGIINYLGEWHTHSCKHPTPSFIDKRLINQIRKDGVSPFEIFLMIIVGQDKNLYIEVTDATYRNRSYTKCINYGDVVL